MFRLSRHICPPSRSEAGLNLVGGAEGGTQFGDCFAERWVFPGPGDFGERDKDEGAFGQAGMRHMEARFVDDAIAVEGDVNVHRARGVAERWLASEFVLDPLDEGEEVMRCKVCAAPERAVEEGWLIRVAPRWRLVERRDGIHPHAARNQPPHGIAQVRGPITEVATDGEGDGDVARLSRIAQPTPRVLSIIRKKGNARSV